MNTIKVVLPLSIDQMKQRIVDPSTVVEVDYAASRLKGRTALIYLTNANIHDVRFDMSGVPRAEVFELIDAYITQKSTIKNQPLLDSVMQILYACKGVPLADIDQQSLNAGSLITKAEVEEYIADPVRLQNVSRLVHLLDSLPVFVLYSNTAFKGTEGEDPSIPVINDIDYTGFTFINLIEIEPFMTSYFSMPPTFQPSYFKQQFEEYMYNSKNLFSYMTGTFMLPLVAEILNGTMSVSQVFEAAASMPDEA